MQRGHPGSARIPRHRRILELRFCRRRERIAHRRFNDVVGAIAPRQESGSPIILQLAQQSDEPSAVQPPLTSRVPRRGNASEVFIIFSMQRSAS